MSDQLFAVRVKHKKEILTVRAQNQLATVKLSSPLNDTSIKVSKMQKNDPNKDHDNAYSSTAEKLTPSAGKVVAIFSPVWRWQVA